MSKYSLLSQSLTDKNKIALICIIGMFVGFLNAPAISSVSMFLFGINAIWGIHPKQWLHNKWWIVGAIWVACYALTWFWSADKPYWETRLQVKLPVLLLPLAFSFLPAFTRKQIKWITLITGLALTLGAIYSLNFLVRDFNYYQTEYKYSHLLPTPVRGDHIRFSLAIALFLTWSLSVFSIIEKTNEKVMLGITVTFLFAYLHILAAKSGLLSVYVLLFGWCMYYVIRRKKLTGVLLMVLFTGIIYYSIQYVPTLKKRYEYVYVSGLQFRNHDATGNYGDINRLISYQVAAKLIAGNPWKGVGTGTMERAMQEGYGRWFPEVKQENILLPHNQFMVVGLGCGIPVMCIFIFWVFYPLRYVRQKPGSFFFFIVWLILLLQLLIEPALEVAYGVFVYLYFLLMQWHYTYVSLPALQVSELTPKTE
jgi:hypothetical protein